MNWVSLNNRIETQNQTSKKVNKQMSILSSKKDVFLSPLVVKIEIVTNEIFLPGPILRFFSILQPHLQAVGTSYIFPSNVETAMQFSEWSRGWARKLSLEKAVVYNRERIRPYVHCCYVFPKHLLLTTVTENTLG